MLFDKQNLFSDGQALTATANSTNVIDLRGTATAAGNNGPFFTDTLGNTVPNDPGKSPELDVLVTVTETFSGGTSVAFALCADDAENFGSPTTLATTPAIAVASLVAGYQARLALPPGIAAADRYLGLVYTVVGTPTLGKVTAALVGRYGKQSAPGTTS